MHISQALITVNDLGPGKLIGRLSRHWAHKLKVEHDETSARIDFSGDSHCLLLVQGGAIAATVEAADIESLAKLEQVVADHLQRMARGETLAIQWRRQE